MRAILLMLCFFVLFSAVALAGPGDGLVQASLFADVVAIKPGQSFKIGVLLKIDPGWHIYWMNPGDSGLATKVKLTLPPDFSAGAVEYPVPERIQLPGDIINYAYEKEVMLLVSVTAPADLSTPITISAKVNWLVCKDICTPGSAVVSLQLPVSSDSSSANAELFQRWTGRLPLQHDSDRVADILRIKDLKLNDSSRLVGTAKITVKWKTAPADIQWFPASIPGVNLTEIKVSNDKNETIIAVHVDASANDGNSPRIESVLAYKIPGGERIGLSLNDPEK